MSTVAEHYDELAEAEGERQIEEGRHDPRPFRREALLERPAGQAPEKRVEVSFGATSEDVGSMMTRIGDGR